MSIHYERCSVTPTLDTGAYSDGDLLANPTVIPNFQFPQGLAVGKVQQCHVHDESAQVLAFDVYFTMDGTSWGTLNDAINISDALLAGIMGRIRFEDADFDSFSAGSVALKTDQNLLITHGDDTRSVYVAMVSRGAGTYSADGLTLTFTFAFQT